MVSCISWFAICVYISYQEKDTVRGYTNVGDVMVNGLHILLDWSINLMDFPCLGNRSNFLLSNNKSIE